MIKPFFAAVLSFTNALEMAFVPELGLGSAIGEDGSATFATAFDQLNMRDTRLLRKETGKTRERIENTKVYDYASKAEAIMRNAGFSFEGWGGSAQVNFGFKEQYDAGSNVVSYVNSRRLEKGFEGWTSMFPPLSLDALLMLE